MGDHRIAIVRNQNAVGFCRNTEHFRIGNTPRTSLSRRQKIDSRLAQQQTFDDAIVQIGIGQKSGPQV